MARRDLGAAATLVAALALAACVTARADAYRILHVESLGIAVDRTRVRMGEDFHLTVRAVVADDVPALPELVLPDLTAFQVLADTQRYEHLRGSTRYTAVLTITPNAPGSTVIGPARIDALSPNGRQALRYSSNTVTVEVLPIGTGVAQTLPGHQRALVLGAVAAVLAGLTLGARGLWSRRPVPAARAGLVQAPALLSTGDELGPWIARLRERPARETAIAARAWLWERLGATGNETAADVARRAGEARWRHAVEAAERAAFVEPEGEAAAARGFADALEETRG